MKKLIILSLMTLTACGSAPSVSIPETKVTVTPKASPSATVVVATPTPTPSPTPAPTIPLTYYKLTKTLATIAPNSIQGVGSCVVYLSNTYCWDNGIQVIASSEFSFWGIDATKNICVGNCASDMMANNPIRITPNMTSWISTMNTMVGAANKRYVADVLAGTPTAVTCTSSGGILNCVDFIIDLNQPNL